MSLTPTKPGRYLDSCGTLYLATAPKKTQPLWTLQRITNKYGADYHSLPFDRADFPAAVANGHFTYSTDQV
jgi:hypothetical protein